MPDSRLMPPAAVMLLLGLGTGVVPDSGAAQEIFSDGFDTDRVRVSGPIEVVFDWTTDRCDDLDIPDLSARAFTDASGYVQLIAGHTDTRRFRGADPGSIAHECDIVFQTDLDADPAAFNDSEWLASPYTEDGTVVHALVHNEYHGWEHSGQCSAPVNFECWYNAITMASSDDAGASYDHVAPPPAHLAASIPEQYADGAGPFGLFTPSNIIEGPGGFKYAFVKYDAPFSGDQWSCLMRSDDLYDPGAWRFWDGDSFSGTFVNPYPDPPLNAEDHLCAPVDRPDIANMHQSVTRNTTLERYVLVSITGKTIEGRVVFGYFYSFSDDLIDWTERRLLFDPVISFEAENPSDTSYAYAGVIDPDSPSRNFETIDESAYLYMTRFNTSFGPGSLDRDLVRREIRFLDLE